MQSLCFAPPCSSQINSTVGMSRSHTAVVSNIGDGVTASCRRELLPPPAISRMKSCQEVPPCDGIRHSSSSTVLSADAASRKPATMNKSTGDHEPLRRSHTYTSPPSKAKLAPCPPIYVDRLLDQLLSPKSLSRLNTELVLVDTRESRHYTTHHILGARHSNCYTKTMAKRARISWAKWFPNDKNPRGGLDVVVYNQHGDLFEVDQPLKDFIEFLKDAGNSVYFLDGGFERFKKSAPPHLIESCLPCDALKRYAFSPTTPEEQSDDILNATAAQVFPFLYLGNERDSKDLDLLETMGITHILNISNSIPCHFAESGKFKYRQVRATDCNKQDLRVFFEEAIAFIDDARATNGKVLVHCWAGVSRSATIILAYILRHSRLNFAEAFLFLKSKRSIVGPNFNFMGQLERFHTDLVSGSMPRSNSFETWTAAHHQSEDGASSSSSGSDESSDEDNQLTVDGVKSLPMPTVARPFLN